jgi:hypothetical protein|tara:strand:+ start:6559 stop:7809 length:1251 start_codon:yes stop_codon:yes gene_type:complete
VADVTATINYQILAYFGLTNEGGDVFTLDHTTKGKLDDAVYVLAGEVATDITANVSSFSTNRGRNRELDEMQVGTLSADVVDYDGAFIPTAFVAGGTYADNVLPGKRVDVVVAGVTVFSGTIEGWDYRYTADRSVVVSFHAVDALGALGRRRFNAWTATAGQTAGLRITDVLNRSEVEWSPNRSVGTGISTLQGDAVARSSNVLNYLQLVTKSDLGRLFASRQNVLTFTDRHNQVGATIDATFADDGTGIDFRAAMLSYGDELLYTDVSVDRAGGTAQTSTSTAARDLYGLRRLDLSGLLLDSDLQSGDMADWLVGIYQTPQPRIRTIEVPLDQLSSVNQAIVAGLDIGDLVSVSWTPRGASAAMVSSMVVEGVLHSGSAHGVHVAGLALSPVALLEALVLDNTTLGKLGSGVLAF